MYTRKIYEKNLLSSSSDDYDVHKKFRQHEKIETSNRHLLRSVIFGISIGILFVVASLTCQDDIVSVASRRSRVPSNISSASASLQLNSYYYQPNQIDLTFPLESIPIYFINRKIASHRRFFFEKQMQLHNFRYRRVGALRPDISSIDIKLVMEYPRPTLPELACLGSHLIAIYTSVHDDSFASTSKYALIMEDDVEFVMNVDLLQLVQSAPPNFGILQLTTSNSIAMGKLMNEYLSESSIDSSMSNLTRRLWSLRNWTSNLWSTQAYIVNKAVVKPYIDKLVMEESDGQLWITVDSTGPHFPCVGHGGRRPPGFRCVSPFRIVADTFIYAAFSPTWALKIPILNGATIGYRSSIDASEKKKQSFVAAFTNISALVSKIVEQKHLLPPFIAELKNRHIADKE